MMKHEILQYRNAEGVLIIGNWLDSLADKDAAARITARFARLAEGNFGDCKPIGGAIYELRFNFGPGYRVYYTKIGKQIVLLLCGGDKHRQSTDIDRARDYLFDYIKRSKTK